MSVYVTSHVWHHSQLKGTALLLVLALADQANDEGIAWPSVATLAGKTRLSERTVQNLLPDVLATGEVEVLRDTGGPGRPRVYRVVAPAPPARAGRTGKGATFSPMPWKGRKLGEAKGEADAERVQSGPERVKPATEKGEARCTQTVLNREREPSTEPGTEPARAASRAEIIETDLECERCQTKARLFVGVGHAFEVQDGHIVGYHQLERANGARAGPLVLEAPATKPSTS